MEVGMLGLLIDVMFYEIGLLSKILVGILMVNVVLEGKVCLDDDIWMYFDDVYLNLVYKGDFICICYLLLYMSGLLNMLLVEVNIVFVDFMD